jgi:hypothetical protein
VGRYLDLCMCLRVCIVQAYVCVCVAPFHAAYGKVGM